MKETTTLRSLEEAFSGLKEAAARVQRLRQSAERELELARQMKAEARKYRPETGAGSDAQQLTLRTRLANQRDIEELIRKASDEIQKILADIRVIRISAQAELAQAKPGKPAAKGREQPVNRQ